MHHRLVCEFDWHGAGLAKPVSTRCHVTRGTVPAVQDEWASVWGGPSRSGRRLAFPAISVTVGVEPFSLDVPETISALCTFPFCFLGFPDCTHVLEALWSAQSH